MEREIELEHEHSFPIQENIDRVKHEDLLISDMYLSGCDILSIVRQAGLTKQVTLFQSNAGKSSGDIWRKLAANAPALHLGDNKHSDFDVPRQFGIACELYERSNLTEIEHELLSAGLTHLAFLIREVRLRSNNNSYHWLPEISIVKFLGASAKAACRTRQAETS